MLLGVHLWSRDGQRDRSAWSGSALRGTPVMIVGNVALGLLAVAAVAGQTELVCCVLPPLLWLLHQLYAHRLREDEERRTWRAFAEASRVAAPARRAGAWPAKALLAAAFAVPRCARSSWPCSASQTRYRLAQRTGRRGERSPVSATHQADAGRAPHGDPGAGGGGRAGRAC